MEPYRLEIPVESLGTIEHLRAAVRHAVNTYNATEHRGIGRLTPRSLYLKTAPRIDPTASRRSAVLGLFPGHRLTVEPRGVEAANTWYNNDDLHRAYAPGSQVFVRRDPLGRGVFVYPRQLSLRARIPSLFVQSKDAWARSLDPKQFAAAVRGEYAPVRQRVNADRDAVRQATIGGKAARDVKAAIAERAREQDRTRRRRGPTVTADGEDTTATGRVPAATSPRARAKARTAARLATQSRTAEASGAAGAVATGGAPARARVAADTAPVGSPDRDARPRRAWKPTGSRASGGATITETGTTTATGTGSRAPRKATKGAPAAPVKSEPSTLPITAPTRARPKRRGPARDPLGLEASRDAAPSPGDDVSQSA
jgi:hypothetical protein